MGKASRIPSAIDRLREQQIKSTELFALNRVRIVPKTIQAPSGGAAPVGSGVGGTSNFLPLAGGVMTGNIAFDPKAIAAPNGRVNLDPGGEDPKNSSNILVTGIGTSPFNIRFIDGAQRDGQFLLYQGTNQQLQNIQNAITFVITNIVGTGVSNIITATMTSTTGLSNGSLVDVSLTTNFNKQDAVVANLTATTFTYDLGKTGSAIPETTGTVQTGNIFTNDGNTLSLDGTLSLLGAPLILLKFDGTAPAGGGWRPALGGGGTGSIATSYKLPVRVATTVNGALATAYENGDSVDGVTLVTENRILLKNQSTGSENGIYTVNASGAPTRATDFASGLTSVAGSLIPVEEGTANADLVFIVTTNNPTTVGTTVLAFADIGGTNLLSLNNTWTGLNTYQGGIQISDSVSAVHGLLQGLASTGVRLTLTSGEKLQIFDNITNILEINLALGLNMLSHSITNASFIESNTANKPSSGFIRMATTDEIRMRNAGNTNDVIIKSGNDALGNDSVIFNIAGANQFTMSNLNLSVLQNNIINTGNVLPSGSGGSLAVGDATNFYNKMHSQFFIPESATVIPSRFGLSKTGNTLYVNFDNTNADAGFGIYEQGLRRFLFQRTGTTPFVNEFSIGGDPFLTGETYLITMGEGANAAQIKLIEGSGNDLILNRVGGGVTQGVQIQVAGLSAARFLSGEIKIFKPLNVNAQNLTNTVNIKSNGAGGATTGVIGELITANGGFNYFMRDTIAWENDANVKLTFGSGGITLQTNGGTDDIDILAQGTGSSIDILCNTTGTLTIGLPASTGITINNSAITMQGDPLVLTNGTKEIRFLDAIANASVITPIAGDITLFNDLTTGNLSVKKPGGSVVDLEAGGGDVFLANNQTFTGINTFTNGTNGILMSVGSKIEFENASVSNLEIHAESNMRDPGDLTITTRSGLEIDLNTSAVPDTEVFHIGDGQAAPWMLMDDTTVRFNTALTGTTGHEMFLSRNNIPLDGEVISTIFAQAKISAAVFLKFAFIQMSALDVDSVAANNEGEIKIGAVSNNSLNTGITIQGRPGVSGVRLGFYNVAFPTNQQTLSANPTTAEISTVLKNLGLTVN